MRDCFATFLVVADGRVGWQWVAAATTTGADAGASDDGRPGEEPVIGS